MKRAFFIASFFCITLSSYCHPVTRDFDFSIVFGGCFNQDIVSLKINNTMVFDRYAVDNASAERRGNLSLTQTPGGITLFYNGQQKTKKRVKVSHTLEVELTINSEVSRFQVDLRKGKVLLLDNCSGQQVLTTRPVSLEQIQEPVVFM